MRHIIAIATFSFLLAGCSHPQAGDPCTEDAPNCPDDTHALFCDDGYYKLLNCRGALGCQMSAVGSQPVVDCDMSFTQAGDNCLSSYTGFILCESASNALRCTGDVWSERTCTTTCENGTPGIGGMTAPGSCDD